MYPIQSQCGEGTRKPDDVNPPFPRKCEQSENITFPHPSVTRAEINPPVFYEVFALNFVQSMLLLCSGVAFCLKSLSGLSLLTGKRLCDNLKELRWMCSEEGQLLHKSVYFRQQKQLHVRS